MDNNFNQNGQFGGWSSSPYGYGTEMYNEYIIKKAQKDEKKQELKKIGIKTEAPKEIIMNNTLKKILSLPKENAIPVL